MTASITIRLNYLRAARKLSAVEDIRYYLNGVLVEVRSDQVRYVATDGYACLVVRDDSGGGEPCSLIVPNQVIDHFPPFRTDKPSLGPTLHYDPANPSAECRLGNVMFEPVKGKFPDYEKLIPETATKEWTTIQPAFVQRFHEAAKLVFGGKSRSYVEFWPNGPEKVCLVRAQGGDEFVGAVMPFKGSSTPEIPNWLRSEVAEAA